MDEGDGGVGEAGEQEENPPGSYILILFSLLSYLVVFTLSSLSEENLPLAVPGSNILILFSSSSGLVVFTLTRESAREQHSIPDRFMWSLHLLSGTSNESMCLINILQQERKEARSKIRGARPLNLNALQVHKYYTRFNYFMVIDHEQSTLSRDHLLSLSLVSLLVSQSHCLSCSSE